MITGNVKTLECICTIISVDQVHENINPALTTSLYKYFDNIFLGGQAVISKASTS